MKMERILQFGECRCCLSTGRHHDLTKEYLVNGEIRIYKNCLTDYLNIYLTTDNEISTLICSLCIKKLLAAGRFRDRVLECEELLLQTVQNVHEPEFVETLNEEVEPYTTVKEEDVSDCDVYDNTDEKIAFAFEDGSSSDKQDSNTDIPRDTLKNKIEHSRETAFLSRFSPNSVKPLPSRASLISICPVYFGHLERLKDEIVDTETIKRFLQPKLKRLRKSVKNHDVEEEEYVGGIISAKEAQALNAATLLENSNATAFRPKMRSGFPCFYCKNIFVKPNKLREHQLSHPKTDLYRLLKKYTADAMVVYADVTDLKCTICNEVILDLKSLKTHLLSVHNKVFYDKFSDRVIPFKLEDRENYFQCQVCAKVIETFGATDRHMSVHFNNYVCELCGAGFITKHRMKVHAINLHSNSGRVYKCDPCNRIFATNVKLKIHTGNVHQKLKKIRCMECSERFIDFFTRQRHLEEKHGVEPLSYKCTECDKVFNRKYSLTQHFKRIHLATKDVQCDLCPFMCFNKSELNDHMQKHGRTKSHECMHCRKVFARKKALIVHLKTHSNEKNLSCHLCGEAFVLKSGLMSHLKLHTEYQ